jgi:D-alanyl-D-alanine carboxypeptidase/D-alanyl-D-alanine-endopeptidase (penicillin-binding protein 4)
MRGGYGRSKALNDGAPVARAAICPRVTGMKAPLFALLLLSPLPAFAQEGLQAKVEARLREVGPGTRFGLVVADADGREIVAIDPDGRYIPASNTKMFTTAAAFAELPVGEPDASGGAAVRLDRDRPGAPDVVLVGNGDARLSSADDCAVDCLATLADAVAGKTRVVRDVIGDDSLFPDQRWSPGMSWNNIPTRSGTATSALTLDDNELSMLVAPAGIGEAPKIIGMLYFSVDNRAVTVASGKTDLAYDRDPNGMVLRLTGTIAAGAEPERLRFGIDDPAHYAAWRLKALIEARGVRVTGNVAVHHRQLMPSDDPAVRKGAPAARPPAQPVLARLVPPPLAEDMMRINKASQNLHAELALRRLAIRRGSGSLADGLAAVRAMLERAGVPRTGYDFSDGSGMSSYNRIAPRATVTFLRWVAAQPWGAAWRETLPVGGVDGTLSRRFKGTPLEGKLFAKTGTLNATYTLSGYLVAKSGRTLTFSALANDVPEGVAASGAVDAALNLIAEAN